MTTRDTQPIRTPTGLGYGEATQLRNAQRVAPLPDSRGPSPSAPTPPTGGGAPVANIDVYGPSARPDEPATAGAAFGPGSGSTEPLLPASDPGVELLRALILNGHGSPGIRRLLEFAASRSGQ